MSGNIMIEQDAFEWWRSFVAYDNGIWYFILSSKMVGIIDQKMKLKRETYPLFRRRNSLRNLIIAETS